MPPDRPDRLPLETRLREALHATARDQPLRSDFAASVAAGLSDQRAPQPHGWLRFALPSAVALAGILMLIGYSLFSSLNRGPLSGSTAPSASPSQSASEGASPSSSPSAQPSAFTWRMLPSDAFRGAQVAAVTQLGPDLLAITSPFDQVIQPGTWAHPSLWQSTDGLTWQALPESSAFAEVTNRWIDTVNGVIAHGSGLIAVGAQQLFDASLANAEAWTSTDGATWTRAVVSDATDATMNLVYPVADGYVAIGTDGYSPHAGMERGTAIWTSPDGARWSRLPTSAVPSGVAIAGVAEANGRFVAVGGPALGAATPGGVGTSLIWISSDGIHFESAARIPGTPVPSVLPSDAVLRGVAWTGSAFVAVGHHPSGGAFALRSSDGLSWRATDLPAGAAAEAYVTGVVDTRAGLLVMGSALAGASGTDQGIAWASRDGTSWQLLGLPPEFRGVTLTQLLIAGNRILAVGQTDQGAVRVWLLAPTGS